MYHCRSECFVVGNDLSLPIRLYLGSDDAYLARTGHKEIDKRVTLWDDIIFHDGWLGGEWFDTPCPTMVKILEALNDHRCEVLK